MYKFLETHNYPFFKGHREFFRIKDFIWPSNWMEEHFRLSTAYAAQGKIKLFPWQLFPFNIINRFERTTSIAPVQTGKSLIGEGISAYKIDTDNQNMMFIYAKKETIQDVFDERIRPLVKEVPAIRKYWSGYDEDLTRRRIKLSHLIARVASAGLKNEIATFNAGYVYGSEVAKWPKKDFDQFVAIEGRKQASRMLGKKTFTHYETSPEHDEDPSYEIAHREGTIFFKPVYPCPECEKYQLIYDRKIKEIANKKSGEKDHNPERIRRENAAYCECEFCGFHMKDEHRLKMSFDMKWASVDLKNKNKIKKIYNQSGKDLPVFEERYAVCNWNRFVDTTWSFAECLAKYFESLAAKGTEALKTYTNEDMADWVKLKTKKYSDSFLRSKCRPYYQYGDNIVMPSGVSILLVGIDTQDNGFYYVVRGFGTGFESWLIRSDFITCKKEDYSNPQDVFGIVNKEIFLREYKNKEGESLPILGGLIDRGGHRAVDVDYIVSHLPNLNAYIGATSKTAPLMKENKDGIWFGHTERLSRIVAGQMNSKIWHLPKDIQKEYLYQVLNHYDEEYTDTRGNTRKKWITGDVSGKADHFRDCECLIVGTANILELEKHLFDPQNVEQMKQETKKDVQEDKPITNQEANDIIGCFRQEMKDNGWQ